MRNTILALVAVSSLTFAGLPPAFADGVCSDYPRLEDCANSGVRASVYRAAPAHTRHARSYHSNNPYPG
jgi:hypothetical protein